MQDLETILSWWIHTKTNKQHRLIWLTDDFKQFYQHRDQPFKYVVFILTVQWLMLVHIAASLRKIKNPVNVRFVSWYPCIWRKRSWGFISCMQFVPVKESVFSICGVQAWHFQNKTEVFMGSKHLSLPLWVTTTKILPDLNVCQEAVTSQLNSAAKPASFLGTSTTNKVCCALNFLPPKRFRIKLLMKVWSFEVPWKF